MSLDSNTFTAFVEALEATRKLSQSEQAEIRKMKRRINNRESARRSRQEKRDLAVGLESKFADLVETLSKLQMVRIS